MTVFELFGLQHGVAAGLTIALSIALPLGATHLGPRARETTRRVLAICLASYLVVGPLVRAGFYGLPLNENLPLHLCGVSVALGAIVLWWRSYRVYEVAYFWGTGGVLAALLTPDLELGFPDPLFVLFFVGHGLAITGVAYATMVFGFRPRGASVLIAIAATAAYAVVIYPVNLAFGSNYLYLIHKPFRPSPLDYMGPWPWYVLGLGALVVAVCVLFYLPFALHARLARSRGTRA